MYDKLIVIFMILSIVSIIPMFFIKDHTFFFGLALFTNIIQQI
ncbi:hypothetical protein MEG_00184 [Bartonella tamiae Th307]|uniref:Uncharacterized protein n=1 Tax=Bartonella tamiae Th239 TaxID=1094558 RepID=J0QTD0_9HYPH|nr:hypothetical protein ME5_01697 [Bartonella tamiae Th239]EJF95451.1 hypothetical protein MEG_00184 [Bartonella tamiae Th307]